MADQFMWYKYICKNVARRHGKTVTFMPKPIFEDNGSGMHTHISLWKGSTPLFAGDRYAGLSELGLHAAGGLLRHAAAILAFAAPTTNSYRRLVPGFEAPVNLALSARNRSAAIRIPMYSKNPKAKRLEFRCPDPSCNGYLAWSAMVMAMLDGIRHRIDPGDPLDRDIYEMSKEELAGTNKTPGSLDEALRALEEDHHFLTARRRLHGRSGPHMDRLQARQRDRSAAPAPAPARVLSVLRQLNPAPLTSPLAGKEEVGMKKEVLLNFSLLPSTFLLTPAQFAGVRGESGAKRSQPKELVSIGLGQPLLQRAEDRRTAQVPVFAKCLARFRKRIIQAAAPQSLRSHRVPPHAQSLDRAFCCTRKKEPRQIPPRLAAPRDEAGFSIFRPR